MASSGFNPQECSMVLGIPAPVFSSANGAYYQSTSSHPPPSISGSPLSLPEHPWESQAAQGINPVDPSIGPSLSRGDLSISELPGNSHLFYDIFAHPTSNSYLPSGTHEQGLGAHAPGQSTADLQSIVELQAKKVQDLQTQLQAVSQQLTYYRKKAFVFRSLYNRELGLSQHAMISLLQSRQCSSPYIKSLRRGHLEHGGSYSRRVHATSGFQAASGCIPLAQATEAGTLDQAAGFQLGGGSTGGS
ncbi:hypothetical protein BKA70DRAFT_1452038 [Coprinopsis sp. MPI-PUGE-AT-0042]|nr:hypothetical protein BKA70DRAFT_1452038 [Coprinopsis sp. MPI-PUGE-AT-0042]